MLRRIIAAVAVSLAAVAPQASYAAFEKKVALVVGNAAYQNAPPLANPVTDAKAMAAAFERLGFVTVTGFDLDKAGLERTIREFAKQSRDADLTTFFYAGHGIAYNDTNFIVPIDAAFADATALDFEAVSMDFVVKQMRYNDGVSLVFLDACRDNPLASTLTRSMGFSTRSAVSRGLAGMDIKNAGKGLAIAFATSPGEVAYDGAETHSPFTSALLDHIERPGADITEVMSRVTGDVLRTTEERQRPWLNASLTGPVVLKPAPAVAQSVPAVQTASLSPATAVPGAALSDAATPGVTAAPAATRATSANNIEAQTQLFNFAHSTKQLRHYEAYLTTFPDGLYSVIARQEIARLKARGAEPASAASVTAPVAAGTSLAALTPNLEDTAPYAPRTGAQLGTTPAAAGPQVPVVNGPPAPIVVPPFVITEAMTLEEGTPESEAALQMNRTKRREVQQRLNLVDADVGGADGVFGRNTRAGIGFWQGTHGMPQTGYLTAPQLTALEGETKGAYAAMLATQRKVASTRRASTAKASTTRSVRKKVKVTKRTTTKRHATKRHATNRRVTHRRVVRRTTTRRRSNASGNAAAAAFVGGVVGGIIGGAISR